MPAQEILEKYALFMTNTLREKNTPFGTEEFRKASGFRTYEVRCSDADPEILPITRAIIKSSRVLCTHCQKPLLEKRVIVCQGTIPKRGTSIIVAAFCDQNCFVAFFANWQPEEEKTEEKKPTHTRLRLKTGNSKFCYKCGNNYPRPRGIDDQLWGKMIVCPECKRQAPKSEKRYCVRCGKEITDSTRSRECSGCRPSPHEDPKYRYQWKTRCGHKAVISYQRLGVVHGYVFDHGMTTWDANDGHNLNNNPDLDLVEELIDKNLRRRLPLRSRAR